jgi:hypothetical protein
MSRNRRGYSIIEFLILVAIIGIVAVGMSGTRGCVNLSNGAGQKIGQVVKLSQQGFANKTWEGQLIRGGMSGGSGSFGTVPFNFTVEGPELVYKVERFMNEQTEVVIHYRIEGTYSPFRSESNGHFLVSIEPLKNGGIK